MKEIIKYAKKYWQLILTTSYTVALFAIYIVAATNGLPHLDRFGFLFIALLVVGIVFINFVAKRLTRQSPQVKDRMVLSRAIFDGVDRMDSPALMCRSDGRIFWCNESLRSVMADSRKPYGKSVTEILGVSIERIRDASPEDGLGIDFHGRYYIAKYNTIKFERGGALVILTESTEMKTMRDELELIHEKLEESEPVVAYIYIDNLTEMIKYDSESYKPAITKIDEVLRDWALDVKGILKEYERDRYVLVFDRGRLNAYVDKKFDFLDRIRNIRVGAEQLSVTASIGISSIYGTFAEKEKSARAALELALSRGGDQVVVKSDDSTEFYGGRNKSSGKRSSVRSRVVSNELLMHISRSSNVLIMGHRYPDFDSIGASIGIARIAMFCGVDVNIVIDRADKNFALCREVLEEVPEYKRVFISGDEALDMISPDTLVIMTDVNNLAIVHDRAIIDASPKFAVIDHHRKQEEYQRDPIIEYIDPKSSSASELVSEMLDQLLPADTLTPHEANLLLAGIMLDTHSFTRMTGTRTYGAALFLHDAGADAQAVQELFKTELEEYVKEARFRSNVEIYRDTMAIAVCEKDESADSAGDKILAAKASEGLIGVRGIKASFAMTTIGDTIHISARSTGEVNVQLVLEKLHGGGHFDTAGAQLKGIGVTEAVEKLKEAIDDYLDEAKTEEAGKSAATSKKD